MQRIVMIILDMKNLFKSLINKDKLFLYLNKDFENGDYKDGVAVCENGVLAGNCGNDWLYTLE